jgi:hypothetical protein
MPDSEGARVLLVALAAVAANPTTGGDASQRAAQGARQLLDDWRRQVGAPEIEFRRAGRRLAAVFSRLAPARVDESLKAADPADAAWALVAECARLERDFSWDIPLRDVSRAIVEAAIRGVRAMR